MRIRHVIWQPEIEEKLRHKHKVLVEEVEEVLFDKPRIRFVEKGHREGEDLYAAYGQSASGRWLIVFFVLKSEGEALVISARDMERKERRLYARQ
ncbi:MAG: hypothetical protein A2338_05220 [Bacteroidetes bacterium RIFOXYB12_FULL_41_6]|nr:MAG: hypothetical protein A2338_05220 [Bacteroidetes bacterium RIFOXYB12_FULL_41_6]